MKNLSVVDAPGRDSGRAIARLDPEHMANIGVHVGDVITVVGSRKALARAMPTHPEHRGHNRVQLDATLRQNTGSEIGQKVGIARAHVEHARVVVLRTKATLTDQEQEAIAAMVDGLPVQPSDALSLVLFNGKRLECFVASTVPDCAVIIQPNTRLTFATEAAAAKTNIAYEDIGGLGSQLAKIRETIERPLKNPELFQRLGIQPPRGVLLHGPPGCGKTLLARAIAREVNASFFLISGPEIIHKHYGESEAQLRKVFEQATKKTPAIIFLDEVDAIAPRRQDAAGDVERRVVATLLTLMDGMNDRGQVMVIAATNRPNAIDPALRRPGRFDREIAIPIPDRRGRAQILKIHAKQMPLDDDVNLDKWAEIAHGYVGADLEALCREAAMASLRRVLPADEAPSSVDLNALFVTDDDFQKAFREVTPSATREVFVEVPNVPWSHVGGMKHAKQALIEAVEWPLLHAELYQKSGMQPPRGILLTGPPGCGKTLIARALASQSHANFISVKGPQLLDKFVGESERKVRDVFQKAKEAAPCIVFFDEIDALASKRQSDSDPVATRLLGQLLTELDGIEEMNGVLVIGATNRIDVLDPAILRPGRFDEILEIALPDAESRLEIFEIHLRHFPDVLAMAPHFAKLSETLSGAQIADVCRLARMTALRRTLAANGSDVALTELDICDAIETSKKTIRSL